MLRLFVGLELPEDIRARLAGLAAGIPGARWTPEENLHLTLRFIGEVSAPDAEDIHDVLSVVYTRRFAMTIAGVGHFESAGQVHTLWAGIEKNPELTALRDRIDSALKRAGQAGNGQRFVPHITLARLRDAPASRVSTFLAANNLLRAGPIMVDRFTLFSSYLQSSGPIYHAEAEYPLAVAAE
ncbi:MAG: RNA 2',3'-cyclic phosphodiesterase [Alphaproteobacteria bacterium]|nr:RNA 2',3'-cyclic phosphodiesterase [Alphaproteobacteria bacterium]